MNVAENKSRVKKGKSMQ